MRQTMLSYYMLNPGLYVAQSSYGLGVYIITSISVEINEPSYGSNHHAQF